MAQPTGCPTLDFSSGHDPGAVGWSPACRAWSLLGMLHLPLSPACVLSHSKIAPLRSLHKPECWMRTSLTPPSPSTPPPQPVLPALLPSRSPRLPSSAPGDSVLTHPFLDSLSLTVPGTPCHHRLDWCRSILAGPTSAGSLPALRHTAASVIDTYSFLAGNPAVASRCF